jgi:hypothetical protein
MSGKWQVQRGRGEKNTSPTRWMHFHLHFLIRTGALLLVAIGGSALYFEVRNSHFMGVKRIVCVLYRKMKIFPEVYCHFCVFYPESMHLKIRIEAQRSHFIVG